MNGRSLDSFRFEDLLFVNQMTGSGSKSFVSINLETRSPTGSLHSAYESHKGFPNETCYDNNPRRRAITAFKHYAYPMLYSNSTPRSISMIPLSLSLPLPS